MRTIFMGAALLLSILFPLTAEADATMQINKAWSRATPPGAQAGVVYMTIENTGAEADTLQSVSTPLSANAMIHESVMKNGVMTMSHMMALPIPAKGSVLLAPGGLHVMLMGLPQPLKAGTTLPLTLNFEKAGTVTLDVPILAPGKTLE